MNYLALIAVILGVLVLFLNLVFTPAKEVNSEEDLEKLVKNTKIKTNSIVISVHTTKTTSYAYLKNGIILKGDSLFNLKPGQKINIAGKIEHYDNKTYLKV